MGLHRGSWVWCKWCMRCYCWGWESRQWTRSGETGCPYWDCDAGSLDFLEWERIRNLHPNYEEVPASGKVYRVDGWLWCSTCNLCFRFDLEGEHCPSSNCKKLRVNGIYPWWRIRAWNPGFPEVPIKGKTYPDESDRTPTIRGWRRTKEGENQYRKEKDTLRKNEVLCSACDTINPKYRNRCHYCQVVLPDQKGRGKDLRRDLHSSHWSNYPMVINGLKE